MAAARRVLPRGQTLPQDVWYSRHLGILILLWLHAAFIPPFAVVRGYGLAHALLEGAIVPVAAGLATARILPRRTRTAVASLGLLSSSAVLVHLSGGVIEMHFHFFVMVAVVALYQDWIPFLAAIAYVFVHHGLMGALDPGSVYNHMAAHNNPWKWAAIHAFFITGISLVCLVTWRLNELMLDERRRAEERLRQESHIVETLHEVGKALAADLDTRRVIQTVTDAATEATAAAFGAFFYNVVDDDGESYMLYTLSGAPAEAFSKFGLPRNTDVFAPTFSGETVVRLDDVTEDPRYGRMAPHYGMPKGHLPVRSYLAVPVRSRGGDVLGGLFFGHPEPGRFSDVDERIVVGIAGHAAIAIDNAKLFESEREARTTSDAARSRLALLADAGRILTASLEVDAVLRRLARLIAPTMAEHCAVGLIEDDGTVRDVADSVALRAGEDAVADVVRSGQARVVSDPAGATTLVVPMVGRERLLGVLVLGSRLGSAGLGESDLPFVEELARRAAVAVENARLYGRHRTVAETLQHSLLPQRLPRLPGLATAANYMAGGPGVEVGGDWYDVIQLPNGHIGFVMGDVVGRGERAASLMGQLRNALRAYAFDGKGPGEIVDLLNRLLSESGADYMATLVYAVLDPETGELRYVNAGHPPPLLVGPDKETTFLRGASGVPVGALPNGRYSEATVTLEPGATVVLYTDGLVEDRSAPIEDGLRRLAEGVVDAPDDIDGMCAFVFEQGLTGRDVHDDVAVLAFRLLPLGPRLYLHLPSDPSVLPALRATLRRWLADAGATEHEAYELLVACGEACTNAIRHSTGPRAGRFDVELERNGEVRIIVRDHGTWREPRSAVGGRGLAIVEAYVDSLDIVKGSTGTAVHMRRRLAAMEPAAGVP